jgi:hypothetical protein
VKGKFQWQEGYGVFSYANSQVKDVYNYILNQEERHARKTFKEEYLKMLTDYEVDYNEQYLFEWMDEGE